MGTSVAIVSGKGGSGKTIMAAELAILFAARGPVTLMDADTGTGGLSYYLGLKYVHNITEGFTEYALANAGAQSFSERRRKVVELTQPVYDKYTSNTFRFLPVGEHRMLNRALGRESIGADELAEYLESAVRELAGSSDFLVVDCRGGIDNDSLAVCRAVDDVIMVVEADPTSFQASQHLVDVLADNDVAYKLRGFIINKAVDDPTSVASTTGVALRTRYLGAIPFDVDAARSFAVSELPYPRSILGIHLRDAISRVYPKSIGSPPDSQVWKPSDYSSFNVYSPESTRAGLLLSLAVLLLGSVILITGFLGMPIDRGSYLAATGALTLTGGMAASEPFRQLLGRMLNPRRGIRLRARHTRLR